MHCIERHGLFWFSARLYGAPYCTLHNNHRHPVMPVTRPLRITSWRLIYSLSDYWLLSLSLYSQTGKHGSALLQALVWRCAPKRHRAAYFILTVANILPPPLAADNWQVLFFRRILCHCLVPVARHHLQHQPQQKRRSIPTTMDLSLTLCYLLIRFVVPITLGAGKCYIFLFIVRKHATMMANTHDCNCVK